MGLLRSLTVIMLPQITAGKSGTAAEMLWVRLRSITRAQLLTLVESKTCGFHEAGMESAIPHSHLP